MSAAALANVTILVKKIRALAENPHWTTDRRWAIAELAGKALTILDTISYPKPLTTPKEPTIPDVRRLQRLFRIGAGSTSPEQYKSLIGPLSAVERRAMFHTRLIEESGYPALKTVVGVVVSMTYTPHARTIHEIPDATPGTIDMDIVTAPVTFLYMYFHNAEEQIILWLQATQVCNGRLDDYVHIVWEKDIL